MSMYGRAVRGAEAGVLAAGAVELSFFVLDLIRLQPLATPLTITGVVPSPGMLVVDLTGLAGVVAVLWAAFQLILLTAVHLVAFGLVGVAASLLFDWGQTGGVRRMAMVAALCVGAFYATVAASGPMGVVGALDARSVIGINLIGAAVLGGALRWVSKIAAESDDPEGAN